MTFLPIVVRELRVAARRKSVYRTRFWTAFGTVGIGAYTILTTKAMMGRAAGPMVFNTLAILCCLSCLSLARNTADCISEEKREGTLGFLFLTDLKGHDIAFGKLVSSSLVSFYAIIGIFPVVAVSLLLGGVTAVEFWLAALALLNIFFFSHATGLFMSAVCSKRSSATGGTAAILLIYTAGFFALSSWLAATRFQAWAGPFAFLNPAYPLWWACHMGYGGFAGHSEPYWGSMALIHSNAWFFLLLASWWVPRSWQEKAGKGTVRRGERLRLWYHERFTARSELLDANPFLWLSVRNRLGSVRLWVALAVSAGFWLWLLDELRSQDAGVPIAVGAILTNHLLLKIFAAADVANNLEEQRRSGGLELLLSCTPLSVDAVVQGQWLALRRQIFWPTIAVLASDFVTAIIFCARTINGVSSDDKATFVVFVLADVAMLFMDLYALGWVGMWNAMSKRKQRHAAGATVSQILLLPWLIIMGIEMLSGLAGSPVFDSIGSFLTGWFFIGLVVDIGSINLCREPLMNQFRALAAVQADEGLGLFGRLGRALGRMARP